jgi:hypothetical protein
MKRRIMQVSTAVATLTALVAVLGAGVKWH